MNWEVLGELLWIEPSCFHWLHWDQCLRVCRTASSGNAVHWTITHFRQKQVVFLSNHNHCHLDGKKIAGMITWKSCLILCENKRLTEVVPIYRTLYSDPLQVIFYVSFFVQTTLCLHTDLRQQWCSILPFTLQTNAAAYPQNKGAVWKKQVLLEFKICSSN